MKQTVQEKLELRRKAHQHLEDSSNILKRAGSTRHNEGHLKLIQDNLGYILELQNQLEENYAVARD